VLAIFRRAPASSELAIVEAADQDRRAAQLAAREVHVLEGFLPPAAQGSRRNSSQ
jgi:hypothetical protein